MLPIEEALSKILNTTKTLSTETLGLLEARGRVLCEQILAPWDSPRFDNSAMDGFAVRSKDLESASPENPVQLKISEEIPAAHWPQKTVESGHAARIFTGAPMPQGADSIVMQEKTKSNGETVQFFAPVRRENSVRKQGSDLKQGQVFLEQGIVVNSGEIGLLASTGRSFVRVRRRPKVAILSCGNELVELHQTPKPGQLIESNRYALAAQVLEAGAEPIILPLTLDDPEQIKEQIKAGLEADILITSGGASVGDYDLLRPTFDQLGVKEIFWRVAIKPGKPVFYRKTESCSVLGLPGNPASSMVCFEIFVRPVIRKMMGFQKPFQAMIEATLTAPTRPTKKRLHFARGQLRWERDGVYFIPFSSQGSGNLLTMKECEGLAMLPPGTSSVNAGEKVSVLLLSNPSTGQKSWSDPTQLLQKQTQGKRQQSEEKVPIENQGCCD